MDRQGSVLMDKYDLGRLLGQGNFAKVYYGRNLQTGQGVAVKVIDKDKVLMSGLIEQTKREISVMALVKHSNVLELYEVMATKSKIYLVIEHAKGGELFKKLAKGRLKENVARKYFQQLISAVDCCHDRDVYHRDLKPENLLLDENGNLKVSDFGLSALAESKRQDGLLHTTCGTPAYVAPDVICRKGYDGAKADIWSCGVILFVLLAGHLPFQDSNLMEMYKKIRKAEFKFPNWFPREVRKLLSRILDPNPHTRISIAKIKENSWFKKGLESKYVGTKLEENDNICISWPESKPEFAKPMDLNAFDIISLSSGLDLSGLFIRKDQKEELQFISTKPASCIMSKLEEVSTNLKLEVMKKEAGFMRLAGSGKLSIDVEIFEITPTFHLVELKRSFGDKVEFQKMLMKFLRPALEEVVWAWQGEHPINSFAETAKNSF